MQGLHAEWCQYTVNILKDLIVKGDNEVLKLIGESTEKGIVGECSL